jgi:hypothetical protein
MGRARVGSRVRWEPYAESARRPRAQVEGPDMSERNGPDLDLSVTLSALADPVPPAVPVRQLETVKHWATNWLSKSHPDLGREGAVCPFTGMSIKKNLFRVAFVHGNNLGHSRMVGLLEEIAAAFPLLSPAHGPESIYKAVVVVFPDVTEFEQFDAVQNECKNAFVEQGLMVGQFYPGHQQGGLRNPNFSALDAPYAMLAVRHMVATDYPFLCDNDKWMAAYVARFAAATIPAGCAVPDGQDVLPPDRKAPFHIRPGIADTAQPVDGATQRGRKHMAVGDL